MTHAAAGSPSTTDPERTARVDVAVALDVPDADAALSLVDACGPELTWVKVGLQLFISEGPQLLEALQERDLKIFLDLKLHDIPNTVASAVRSASALGVDLLTVHAGGGEAMLRAAAAARDEATDAGSAPRLVAVTVLTSLDAAALGRTWGREATVQVGDEVARLAELAVRAGMDGVVASAQEAAHLRQLLGPDAILVTPGIRMPTDEVGDQARVATPEDAVSDGADLLVVGRPVRNAPDPAAALRRVLASARLGVRS